MSWLLFFVVIAISFGLGYLILRFCRSKLSRLEVFVCATILGMVLWSLLLYITALSQVRWLSLVLVSVLAVKSWHLFGKSIRRLSFRVDGWLALVVALGVAGQIFLVAPSGWNYNDGVRFYGVNAHDAMWHVTLMETLSQPFPPVLPTFTGEPLKGYHFLINLLGSEWVTVFHISPFDLVFRQLPMLLAIIIGLGTYAVMRRLTPSRPAQLMAVFLTYFGSSFGFLLPLFNNRHAGGETAFWAQQSISTFINLPLGASFAVLVCIFILFLSWSSDRNSRSLWLVALLSSAMIGIKAYGGAVTTAAFVGTVMFLMIKARQWRLIFPILLSVIVAAFLILTTVDAGKSSFLWQPGWFLKTMMEAPDRVDFVRWELLRQAYVFEGRYPQLFLLWVLAFIIFFLGNLGSRLLVLLFPIYAARQPRFWPFYLWVGLMILAGTVLPLLLIQSGIVWNAIQFFYYVLFVLNLLAGLSLTLLGRHRSLTLVSIFLIIVVSLIGSLGRLKEYGDMYSSGGTYQLVSHEQLAALSYLKALPDAVILTAYHENSYVSAFTGKSVYFTDETQATILGLSDALDRKRVLNNIFCGRMKAEEIRALMESYSLTHVYVDSHSECQRSDFSAMDFLESVYVSDITKLYRLR